MLKIGGCPRCGDQNCIAMSCTHTMSVDISKIFKPKIIDRPNPWKEALLDELANCALDCPVGTSPAKIIRMIINFHVELALNNTEVEI